MVRVKVFIEKRNEEREVELNGKTIQDLLKLLKVEASRVVVIKNGEIVTEDEEVSNGDYIKIIDVVSGG